MSKTVISGGSTTPTTGNVVAHTSHLNFAVDG